MSAAGPPQGRPRERGEAQARRARARAWTAADTPLRGFANRLTEAANSALWGAAQRHSRKRGGII